MNLILCAEPIESNVIRISIFGEDQLEMTEFSKKKSGTKLLNFHIARPEFPVNFFAIFAIGVPPQYLPLYLKLSEKSTS